MKTRSYRALYWATMPHFSRGEYRVVYRTKRFVWMVAHKGRMGRMPVYHWERRA